MFNQTIVSLITPPMMGAVAVIRMSGDDALEIAQQMFSRKISEPNRVYYGRIVDKQETIDEVVLTYFKGPRSFTGEDVVEISCHGSMLVANQIISLAISLGARLAQRGEFSSRAYYKNKNDLVQAEAINSLIKAVTPEQKQLALYSLKGETSNVLKPIIDGLADILSNIEVNIDYPEYMDIEVVTTDKIITSCHNMRESITSLLLQSKRSQYVVQGIKVALVGLPNTGKSSLLNAFLNEDKAIVTNIPGTTRDVVEGTVNLNGLLVNLLDTAGIRECDNIVEQKGIEKSQKSIETADLIIMVTEAGREFNEEELEIYETIKNKKHIVVFNKSDLTDSFDKEGIYISAQNKDIDNLKRKMLEMFDLLSNDMTPSLCSAREIALLSSAEAHLERAVEDAKNYIPLDLVVVSIKAAYDDLKEILGLSVNIDLSEEIFSRFCVGK